MAVLALAMLVAACHSGDRGKRLGDAVGAAPAVSTIEDATPDDIDHACIALVVRNDPAERGRHERFFERACTGYDLPVSWTLARGDGVAPDSASIRPSAPVATHASVLQAPPQTRAQPVADTSAPALPTEQTVQESSRPAARAATDDAGGKWPPRAGPAYQCRKAWKRVEHMICADKGLSLLDWELARAYAKARRAVGDRAALQREEDAWRFEVRDECITKSCVEATYVRRIAELEDMADG